ncbi:hypothetical protein LQU92_06320 [Kocuria sp. LUK]|uniref:Uncharacterized protein n=1 Tax=Kocuria flava TaxID=446860 RepID=A0A2N4T504_9MICC|nr:MULTISPECIES: hypothetical protein [Kocuria]MCD1144859.1 hypothetical protein [Kocuria sp. LUK]PLC13304.1 hypothetical protein AUQ48_15155 [Kocuria flava]
MTSHWLRDPGPASWALIVLTAVLAVATVLLHLAGRGDPAAGEPGSARNVALFATFVCAFAAWVSGRGRG